MLCMLRFSIWRILLLYETLWSLLLSGDAAPVCGSGTYLDTDNDLCLCDGAKVCGSGSLKQKSNNTVYIVGIFDAEQYSWGAEVFNFTVSLINDHNNGWHDSIFDDDTVLEWAVADSKCDGTTAARAYWDLRTQWGGPMHGIIGCRCSSASVAVAQIAGLEGVPQVSPSSTSSKLSDIEEFPFFSRVVAPDNARGEVGAIVSMLRLFEWDRVTILSTDTQYAKDFSIEFRRLWLVRETSDNVVWEGKVAYSHTIALDDKGGVNKDSVHQALDGVPTDDPTVNSRVILLLAHDKHAYQVLQIATERIFQPDTIWVGPLAWVGRLPTETPWIPPVPGYLGLTPFRNRNWDYYDYLERLQFVQKKEKRDLWTELPDADTAHIVDAIISLTKALSTIPHDIRGNGSVVTSRLRELVFYGISGEISFTEQGDRPNPQYAISNLQWQNSEFVYVEVGSTGTTPGSALLNEDGIQGLCFAGAGCQLSEAPSDKYPIPVARVKSWAIAVMSLFAILFVGIAFLYFRTRRKTNKLRKKVDAMKKIDTELVGIDAQVEAAKKRQEQLINKRAQLQERPDTWSESKETLVEVAPENEQYWNVNSLLNENMPDAHISKLWRIQNVSLWTYYSFHKDRLSMNGINHNEKSVWHGTSFLDPAVIYNDRQDGFMMQFSQTGFWGRGIYFAEKSSYSHSYAYKSISCDGRPRCMGDEREMFLTKLLRGNEVVMDRDESRQKADQCRALTVPPTDTKTNLKYNTVTGNSAGSQVWIVYENGRAYPDYLVRYYRGERDTSRTPLKSLSAAMKRVSSKKQKSLLKKAVNVNATFIWEYLDNDGWKQYNPAHQLLIENAYKKIESGKGAATSSKVQIETDSWKYEVDIGAMVQTNKQHSSHTQRRIRRQAVIGV